MPKYQQVTLLAFVLHLKRMRLHDLSTAHMYENTDSVSSHPTLTEKMLCDITEKVIEEIETGTEKLILF